MAKPSSKRAATPSPEALLDAAIALIATRGWHEFTLSALAAASDASLADIYRVFPDRVAVLTAYLTRLDERVLAGEPVAEDGPARDRLFDAAMQVLEAAEPEKDFIRVLTRELPSDPTSLLALRHAVTRSARWTLERASLPVHGFAGGFRLMGFALILAQTVPIWVDDDAGLAKTMAALDRQLRRAEGWVSRLGLGTARAAPPPGADTVH